MAGEAARPRCRIHNREPRCVDDRYTSSGFAGIGRDKLMAKSMRGPQSVASSFGMAVFGVVELIGGNVLERHFQLHAAFCNTFGGSTSHCFAPGMAVTAGQIMQGTGEAFIGIGLIFGVFHLFSRNRASRPTGSPQTSGTPRTRTQPDPSAKVIDTQKLLTPREVGEQRRPPADDKNDW